MHGRKPEAEEYLELIFRLTEEGKEPRVKEIASRLGISPASVSEMLRKLARDGFVEAERYGEIRLTKKGEEEGKRVLRKHRIIENFLVLIGVKKKKLHEEACVLEHAVSDDVERRLLRAVKEGRLLSVPLTSFQEGAKGTIARIEAGPKASQRLADMGLTRGTEITLLKSAPFRGAVTISVRGTRLALGRKVAARIFAEVR